MSAVYDSRSETAGTPARAGNSAEAIYFPSDDHRLFGWLHHTPPESAVAGVAVVICKPFGYEAICSHRSLRVFAEELSSIGFPVLRFDYLGTGDSSDIDPHADQVETWTKDVITAIGEVKRRTGVVRVCLIGVRLGALLAIQAAGRCHSISGLVLISPILSGRRYLREIRAIRLAASIGTEIPRPVAGIDGQADGNASLEVSGFSLSAATLNELRKIDLTEEPMPSALQLLIIDGNSMQGARAWAEAMAHSRGHTNYLALPGVVEMIMTAPQSAVVPREIISSTRDWFLQNSEFVAAIAPEDANSHRIKNSEPYPSVLVLPGAGVGAHLSLTERAVFLDDDALVFGIVTEPRKDESRRRAVILLNAGGTHHVGASNLYVSSARRWARSGYVVLRMDLAGLGDSGTRRGRLDNEVFPVEALEDIKIAIEFLRGRYGIREMTVAGLCSGAYHALRAAAAGLDLSRIILLNPQNFFWGSDDTLEGLQLAEVVRNPKVYRERIFSFQAWKRLFTGQVNMARIMKIYLQRPLLAVEASGRNLARRLHIRLSNDLGTELEEIVARGIEVIFIFAHGEPGIDLLQIQAGSSLNRLGERCRIHVINDADHVFTRSEPRAKMEKVLCDELYSRTGGRETGRTIHAS
jgi:alpha-beta hydrolase superfamily lysophospholipase